MLGIAAGVVLAARICGADLLVNFYTNNTWVTGNTTGQGISGGAVAWSLSNPRNPAANYTGPTYYGGATGSVAIGASGFSVVNATPDYLNASGASSGAGNWMTLVPMFVLDQAYSITNVSLRARLSGSAAAQTNYVRLVMEQDGNLYVSGTNWYNIAIAGQRIYNNETLSALSWYSYDPVNNLLGNEGAPVAGIGPTNATAIGVLLYNENLATRAPTIGMSEFIAYGDMVVPEPASVVLIGFGVSLLALARRRRR
jgi:hypothetical protein